MEPESDRVAFLLPPRSNDDVNHIYLPKPPPGLLQNAFCDPMVCFFHVI